MSRRTVAYLEELLKYSENTVVYKQAKVKDLEAEISALKMKLSILAEISSLGGGLSSVVIAMERCSQGAAEALAISNQQMLYLLRTAGIKFPKE